MPDFARAKISSTTEDLSEYKNFLRGLKVGQVVTLPLKEGEATRKVMRAINAAVAESNIRITRLPSDERSVRFRVAAAEKRTLNVPPEVIRARVEKARATREAKREAAEVQS